MTAHTQDLAGGWRRGRLRGSRDDAGFTLTEMVVTVAILAVAIGLLTGLIIGFDSQTTDLSDSVQAVRQASFAQVSLVQYLRGSTQILSETPSTAAAPVTASQTTDATDLTMVVAEGFSTSTYTSSSTTVCVQWLPGAAGADAKFEITYDCGTAHQRTVATYFALSSQSVPVFTYYKYDASGNLVALPITDPVPSCAIGEIAAVGVHVTFLSGPQVPTQGYAADLPTTLDTTVFLQGANLNSASTTTTSTTGVCPE